MELPATSTASPSDRQRVLATVVMGFSSDPLTRWFWPDASTYLRSGEAYDAFGGGSIDSGTTFVTSNFEGAALWMSPGVESDEDRMGKFLEETIAPELLDEVMAVFEKMDSFHPHEACWYLPLIAVDPAHQGKGFGAALMKAALERVDEDGLPAYLESSNQRNVSLYLRHGFEVMDEIQIGSSPVVTPMLRPAR